MKLVDFRLDRETDEITASVNVIFEDCDLPEKRVFFKTPTAFANGFDASPNAFLVGCLLPALHLGERRIFVEGDVCPFLREGIGGGHAYSFPLDPRKIPADPC